MSTIIEKLKNKQRLKKRKSLLHIIISILLMSKSGTRILRNLFKFTLKVGNRTETGFRICQATHLQDFFYIFHKMQILLEIVIMQITEITFCLFWIFGNISMRYWCGSRPAGSVCCGSNGQIHMDYRNPVEKKGQCGCSLSEREGERAGGPESPTLAWTGFYCFSGCITLRMILIYYAQDCCRWLPLTDNKGKNVANYFKEKDVAEQEGKWLNSLHSILGRFSTDFRKLKICSKHLLPQSRVREF